MAHAAPLARSAAKKGGAPQLYSAHILAVIDRAKSSALEAAQFAWDPAAGLALVKSVMDASTFHDLGKLDPDNQVILQGSHKGAMCWDHIDAGVAHLMALGAGSAAWIVRGHHAPGLPEKAKHFSVYGRNPDQVRRLRGRRNDDEHSDRHASQIARTDAQLATMLALHEAEIGASQPAGGKTKHGFTLRLGLSCLVDADHSDSAVADGGTARPCAPAPRWEERLAALDRYVGRLQGSAGPRSDDRAAFYAACRNHRPDSAMVACEGPVGIGKTTAVTAYLLRRAIAAKCRRLFVVAPYTAILSQTADTLRKALTLDDEGPIAQMVVAEHHHRADFDDIGSRDLAMTWSAPIVLTTAVQFFETLAGNTPAALRKLHALPGSVVFLDEAHAAMPSHLWPQNWRWLQYLSKEWSCSFVFASGSLSRFWENPDIVGEAGIKLPELATPELGRHLIAGEGSRVAYESLGCLNGMAEIAEATLKASGPRLLIMNTVQSAAVMAHHMRRAGHDVLHISTALCPTDRERVLKKIKARLKESGDREWTLVATSLVEAGVDFSFRSALRERFSAASLIQVGGRTNRHAELDGPGTVQDFFYDGGGLLKRHPAATRPGNVLRDLFAEGKFSGAFDPASLVTLAMQRELRDDGARLGKELLDAEAANDYPKVAKLGRIIDSDTRLVVVQQHLRQRLADFESVQTRFLLSGSVQIWSNAIATFGLETIAGRPDVYWWPHRYDGSFLGYMEGALPLLSGEAFIL